MRKIGNRTRKDKMSIFVETLIRLLTEYSLYETRDGKYSLRLKQKDNCGIYELIIVDREKGTYR